MLDPAHDLLRVARKHAFEHYLRTGDAHRYLDALSGEAKYNPDQPRVAAGNSDGGQWTSGGGIGGVGNGARREPPQVVQIAFAGAVEKGIEAALALYVFLSGQEASDDTPFAQFNAQAFFPGAKEENPAVKVGNLTREEVDVACPRHELVQSLTDEAAERATGEGNYWTPSGYGTRVHVYVRDSVDGFNDVNFQAEQSFIKSDEAGYGQKGSVRIDVIENVGNGNVCVYDIKTGSAGLTQQRMQEIANNVHTHYPGTKKIIVIETRPMRRRRKRK